MKATGRGCAPTRKAWPISISPRRTSSSSPRSGRSCARSWREASGRTGVAFLSTRRKQTLRGATMLTPADKRAAFRKLHESGCFIIPNPFDVGSARALQHLGFKALASTSAGFAWTPAYAEAGADCLYAPGISTPEEISTVVKAVAPKPVNLLVGAAGPSLKVAGDLGVRRISVGGALARMAWTGFMKASKEMAEQGTFTEFANGYPGGELNKMFS